MIDTPNAVSFNTQPPEGGWNPAGVDFDSNSVVSTHSRPKAAGNFFGEHGCSADVSTHSRPKAAGRVGVMCFIDNQFQHTAARRRLGHGINRICGVVLVSTHSRPKAAGASLKSLAPSGFAAPISLGSQEKREREYNTAFSVTPAFAIS